MAKIVPKSLRICATCNYWGGSRNANRTRTHVEFDDKIKGECVGGGHNRGHMQWGSTCGKWVKWAVIK